MNNTEQAVETASIETVAKSKNSFFAENLIPQIQRWALYAVGFLLPLWFLPFGGIEVSRELFFGVILLVCFGLWFAGALLSNKFTYIKSPVNIALGFFLLAHIISAAFSKTWYFSFLSSDVTAEKLSSLFLYAIAYFLVIAVLRQANDATIFPFLFVAASGLMALITLPQFFNIYILPLENTHRLDFNVIGTLSSLASFYAFAFLLAMGFILSAQKKIEVMPLLWRAGIFAATALLILNLTVINFTKVWVGLFVGLAALMILYARQNSENRLFDGRFYGLIAPTSVLTVSFLIATFFQKWYSWQMSGYLGRFMLNLSFYLEWMMLLLGILLLALAFFYRKRDFGGISLDNSSFYSLAAFMAAALLFIFMRMPFFPSVDVPAEVFPSQSETFNIAVKTWKDGIKSALFGVGPGMFQHGYILHHGDLINQTVFFGARFTRGYSYFTTALVTSGLVGAISLLLAVAGFLWIMAKAVFRRAEHPMFYGLFSGGLFLVLAWFLQPANFTLNLMLFFTAGFLTVMAQKQGDVRLGERVISWNTPWANFALSLMSVLFIGLSLFGSYMYGQRYGAAVSVERAVNSLQKGESVDAVIRHLSRAAETDYLNDGYFRFLAQGRLLKVKNIINESNNPNPPTNLQADFKKTFEEAVAAVQRAIQLNEIEPFNHRTSGSIYETLIPFEPQIAGADKAAFNAYKRAAELDVLNPMVYAELARAYLAAADTRVMLIQQKNVPQEQIKLWDSERTSYLESARSALAKSVSLKGDYATAHYMLAQTALREGKLPEAVKNLEDARQSAPKDIGVLFQLGILYYQSQQYGRAEEVFARTVELNPDYSNARYFLGILLARRGENDSAIKQFLRIVELNPDNQEARQIMENIKASQPALTGIAQPPQARKDVPITQKGGEKQTPIRKR